MRLLRLATASLLLAAHCRAVETAAAPYSAAACTAAKQKIIAKIAGPAWPENFVDAGAAHSWLDDGQLGIGPAKYTNVMKLMPLFDPGTATGLSPEPFAPNNKPNPDLTRLGRPVWWAGFVPDDSPFLNKGASKPIANSKLIEGVTKLKGYTDMHIVARGYLPLDGFVASCNDTEKHPFWELWSGMFTATGLNRAKKVQKKMGASAAAITVFINKQTKLGGCTERCYEDSHFSKVELEKIRLYSELNKMIGKLTLNMLTFTFDNCKELETIFKTQVTKGEVLLNCIQCSGEAARDPAKCLAENPAVLKSVGAGAVDAAELASATVVASRLGDGDTSVKRAWRGKRTRM